MLKHNYQNMDNWGDIIAPVVLFGVLMPTDDEFEAMLRETAEVVRRSFASDWEVIKSEAVHFQIDKLIGINQQNQTRLKTLGILLDPVEDRHVRYRLQIHLDLLLKFKEAGFKL